MAETCVLTAMRERTADQRRTDRPAVRKASEDGEGQEEDSARIGGDTGRRAAIERTRKRLAMLVM